MTITAYRNTTTNETAPSHRIGVDEDGDELFLVPEGWEPMEPYWLDENGLAHACDHAYAQATENTRRHHITNERAPVVEIATITEGAIVRLPDERLGYVHEEAGEWGVYRHTVALDAGGNEWARRTAPQSTHGIAAGPLHLTVVGDELLAWIRD